MAPAAAGITGQTPEERGAIPVPAAPRNVFLHPSTKSPTATKSPTSAKANTNTTSNNRKWINYYELPVEYSVEIHSNLLCPSNDTLATRFMPPTIPPRRFCVVDSAVARLYGDRIRAYFAAHSVQLRIVVIDGEEDNKIFAAVERIFNAMCEFALLRREPVVAIGGGCVLDVVGFAASMYRRGVPYIRVPTTLLAIVDASVGVKTGVDWHHATMGGLKNRMGAFYPPVAAFLDKAFIATQDERNLVNGMGEIMKLALVRSMELFELLESHGRQLVKSRFQSAIPGTDAMQDGSVADRVIELSIQVMLEELGPNLWEYHLERCVDYGHTFSKILEMHASPTIMHGEAVNVDSFLCIALSHRKGWIDTPVRNRILKVMREIGLPTWNRTCSLKLMSKAVEDGTEHRHGKLRMPLVRGAIGQYDFVNECNENDLRGMLNDVLELHPGEEILDAQGL